MRGVPEGPIILESQWRSIRDDELIIRRSESCETDPLVETEACNNFPGPTIERRTWRNARKFVASLGETMFEPSSE